MKTPLYFSAAMLLLVAGCGNNSDKSASKTSSASSNISEVVNAPADYLGGLQRSEVLANKTVDTASLNKDIQMFQVDNGRYPKDLNELVEQKYIGKLPQAPPGMKINYDPNTGLVTVVK